MFASQLRCTIELEVCSGVFALPNNSKLGMAKMFVYCQHDWFHELLRPSHVCLDGVQGRCVFCHRLLVCQAGCYGFSTSSPCHHVGSLGFVTALGQFHRTVIDSCWILSSNIFNPLFLLHLLVLACLESNLPCTTVRMWHHVQ